MTQRLKKVLKLYLWTIKLEILYIQSVQRVLKLKYTLMFVTHLLLLGLVLLVFRLEALLWRGGAAGLVTSPPSPAPSRASELLLRLGATWSENNMSVAQRSAF